MTLSRRGLAYALLLTNTITWGAALVLVKPGLMVTTPFRFLLYRYVLAIILTLPVLAFYLYRKTIKNWPRTIGVVFLAEFFGTVIALSCLYFGLQQTTALEASLIASSSPIFMTFAGLLWLHEKQEKHEWLGLGIALVGTTILTFIPFVGHQLGLTPSLSLLGNALIIVHNIASALYFVLAKRYFAKLPKLLTSTIGFYIGAVVFLALSWWERGSFTNLLHIIPVDLASIDVWIASGYMALFGSVIGLTAYIKGQDLIETSEASWFWYLQPLVYIPLAWLALDEHIQWYQLGALMLIFGGVMLAEKRFKHPWPWLRWLFPTPKRPNKHVHRV